MNAVLADGALLAPTLGLFRPALTVGAHVTPGLVLGTLERLGRRLELLAPAGAHGQVLRTEAAYVQYGDVLLSLGAVDLADAAAVAEQGQTGESIASPMAGIVYLSPSPGEPPFTAPGQAVKRNATVALVEVMKTFTPLKSDRDGVVSSVAVTDGQAVEAGDPILWLQ